jgi:hypothetical protein
MRLDSSRWIKPGSYTCLKFRGPEHDASNVGTNDEPPPADAAAQSNSKCHPKRCYNAQEGWMWSDNSRWIKPRS